MYIIYIYIIIIYIYIYSYIHIYMHKYIYIPLSNPNELDDNVHQLHQRTGASCRILPEKKYLVVNYPRIVSRL